MSEAKRKASASGEAVEYVPTHRLFNVEDYYRMVDAGILREDERVELIRGEILKLAPIGSKHMYCVNEFTERFIVAFGGRAIVSPQNSVRLGGCSQPQPDLALLRPRRDPSAWGYQHVETVPDNGAVAPAAFPDIVMPVHELVAMDVEDQTPETR